MILNWAGSVALWIGSIVHKWLERIVRSGIGELELGAADRGTSPNGKPHCFLWGMNKGEEELNAALMRVETALVNVFKDPTGQWLLRNGYQQIRGGVAVDWIH